MQRSAQLIFFVVLLGAAACGRSVHSVGLRPEYPELQPTSWCDDRALVVEVDSLQPTFRWAPFPNAEKYGETVRTMLARAENVRYDLRVWRVVMRTSGAAEPKHGVRVYERQGLRAPWHRIEELLDPTTPYVWSVRARFDLDGQTRATECGSVDVGDIYDAGRSSPRSANILAPLYYPFRTPARLLHRLRESGHVNPDPQ